MRKRTLLVEIPFLAWAAFCLPYCGPGTVGGPGTVEGCTDNLDCTFEPNLFCDLSEHRCVANSCTPDCADRECGPDPQNCGTSCGICGEPNQQCNLTSGQCTTESPCSNASDVDGIVLDATNETPVSGAIVSLTGQSQTTDSAGAFAFECITPGSQTVTAVADGYENASQALALKTGPNSVVFKLTPSSDVAPPQITINSPANNETVNTSTVTVEGTASDDVGLSKVEVRVGTGAYAPASGTETWSTVVTLAPGANTITAKATDTSGNLTDASLTVTYESTDPALEIGVFNREPVPAVDDPLMKWQIIASASGLTAYPRSEKVGFNLWSDWSKTKAKWTDQSFIQSRFDRADEYKNEYEYAPFLLHEEMFGPIALSTWAEPKSAWQTSGTISFATGTGIKVEAMLRDTYKSATGKSEQEWEVYYTTILYKAWNEHVHALGRKSMVIGFLPAGKNGNLKADMAYQTPAWDYILKNYDAIVDYSYPQTTAEVSYSSNKAQFIKDKYTAPNGRLVWILTSSFGDWAWKWSEAVAQSEFNAVASFVDVIIAYPYTNMGSRTTPYPQYLLKFFRAKYGP